MKTLFKTPIALAVAALCATPLAFAGENETGDYRHKEGATLIKKLKVEKDITIEGTVRVSGAIDLDSSAIAVVDDKQVSFGNNFPLVRVIAEPTLDEMESFDSVESLDTVDSNGYFPQNVLLTNSATASDFVMQEASGNLNLNVAAGDNNQQANAVALAAADARFVFGSSDAEVFAYQLAALNLTFNEGTTNTATVGDFVMQYATGNIGVNVAAGNSNQQKNDLASAVSYSRMSEATVSADQLNGFNQTSNEPGELLFLPVPTTNTASVQHNALQFATGNIGVNVAAGSNNQQFNGLAVAASFSPASE